METKKNIGKWTALVKNEGKTPQITVDGTFPTNGEKPGYNLTKNAPQGVNPTELLLTLVFGNLVISEGTVFFLYTLMKPLLQWDNIKPY
jgi:hypothetical protein